MFVEGLSTDPIPSGIDWTGKPILGEFDIGGVQYSFRTTAPGQGVWLTWLAGPPHSTQIWYDQFCGYLNNVTVVEPCGTVVSSGRPYCFLKGSDDGLWLCYYDDRPELVYQGRPSDQVSVAAPLGALTVNDDQPHCFVLGSDGHLWVNFWNPDERRFVWEHLGIPFEGLVMSRFGAAAGYDGGRAFVFVTGNDGNLWYWQPGYLWGCAYSPEGGLAAPVGVTEGGLGQPPIAWMLGKDSSIQSAYWNPGEKRWIWSSSAPPPAPLESPLAMKHTPNLHIFAWGKTAADTVDDDPRGAPARGLAAPSASNPVAYCYRGAGQLWQTIAFPNRPFAGETRAGWSESGQVVLVTIAADGAHVLTAVEIEHSWHWTSLPIRAVAADATPEEEPAGA